MIKSYKELTVWQKGIDLVEVYKLTSHFPKEEIYGLTNQMRRSAVSIPSNIAEGNGRQYIKEYIQFLRIAFASGSELETQIIIAKKLQYSKPEVFDIIDMLLDEVMKMLNVLMSALEKKQ